MSGDRPSRLPQGFIVRQKQPYKRQAGLDEPRHDVSGHGPLRTFDVFALIVNKMVGTGIYTAPASVFLMTGNKSLTLGLFGIGFLYSLVRYVSLRARRNHLDSHLTVKSMIIYLDFAKVLPFNGGELIYVGCTPS